MRPPHAPPSALEWPTCFGRWHKKVGQMPHAGRLLPFIILASSVAAHPPAEPSPSIRSGIHERLREDFPYRPKPPASAEGEAPTDDVVRMEPFLVNEKKDKSAEFGRILRAQRQQQLARRPSLEGGASLDTTRATIGVRPYRDLLADDAIFRSATSVTPTWTLLDMKF